MGWKEGRNPVCFQLQTGTTFLKDNLTVSIKLIVPMSLNQSSICGNLSYRNTFISKQEYIYETPFNTLVMLCCIALSRSTYLTLSDPKHCSPPDSYVHGDSSGRILQWVAMPSSRGSSQPRDQTQVSRNAGIFFTI